MVNESQNLSCNCGTLRPYAQLALVRIPRAVVILLEGFVNRVLVSDVKAFCCEIGDNAC